MLSVNCVDACKKICSLHGYFKISSKLPDSNVVETISSKTIKEMNKLWL